MKMRFIFVLSLATFFNPISVMAVEKFVVSAQKMKCGKAGMKMLPEDSARGIASATKRTTLSASAKGLTTRSVR